MLFNKNSLNILFLLIASSIILTFIQFKIILKKLTILPQEIEEKIVLARVNEKLVDYLKVYTAYDEKGPLQLVRLGQDYNRGYIVPAKACTEADVLLGYGMDYDNSFEEDFSRIYNKPSYGFDCGNDHIDSKSPLFTFVNECISTDKFLFKGQESSGNITSFQQQIKKLGLKDKKLLIKMDIEGAEYEALDEILQYHSNLTGIVFEVHFYFDEQETTRKALKLLKKLDKHFLLLHLHALPTQSTMITSNAIGKVPKLIELTYINKSLVTNYHLIRNQTHPTNIDMGTSPNFPDPKFEILP